MKKSSSRGYAQSHQNRVSSDDEESRIDETDGEFIVSQDDDAGEVRGSTRDTRRLAMELDRQALEAENLDAEELALKMTQRYGRRRDQISQMKSSIPTQFTAGVNQPNLFVVRWKEKDVVLQFMKQFKESQYSQHPIDILSATCRDALKGYVYVEAWKLAHVQKAVQNMNNLFNSAIKLVPLEERSQVLTIKRKEKGPKEGSWARVRKGKYAGDIVQIAWVYEQNSNEVKIRCVPRADDKGTGQNNISKRKKPANATVKDFDNGYTERDTKISNLIWDANPTMDEIKEFLSAADSHTRNSDGPATLPIKAVFFPGDEVEIISGSDRGVYGFVESVNKEHITFNRASSGRHQVQQVTVHSDQIAKRFNIGDHVQVLNGSHQGEAGMIVNIDKNKNYVTLWSDITKSEIKVFSKDLKKITEATVSKTSGLDYAVQDFVLNIDRGKYSVLDTNGNTSTYIRDEIITKEDTRRFSTAIGQNQVLLKIGDVVTDTSAENREGKILHFFRKYAFILSRGGIIENGGIFMGLALDKLNPEVLASMPAQPPAQSYNRQTVTITKGPYKGYLGIVKDTTPVLARVELHTNCSIVNVEKTKLVNVDTSRPVVLPEPSTNRNTREFSPAPSNYSGSSWQSSNVRTPNTWNGTRTPSTWNSSMTPNTITSDGTRTPSHADGSRTPAVHLNDGSRTPAWDLGSKTPAYAGSDGSRTPAWDTGSRTPAYVAENRARTPAWEASFAATPAAAETPNFTAPTPAADTPGFTAPTPAADTPLFSAPTPANSGNLMIPATPGPAPMTPANLLPQTPFVPASTVPTAGDFRQIRQETNSNPNEWLTLDIQVRIIPDKTTGTSFENGQYDNRTGVISSLESQTTCIVNLDDSQEQCFIDQQFLVPVPPQKKEKIKMIAGDFKGQLGILVGVDGFDGVVKVKGGKDFKIVNMSMMAKYVGEEVAEE
ncbi:6968_t:CDS:10 [Diversispora eburnea]|uniref:Transcription elongation factor SPT5 n=1 Tax=Diversispora eburnea TaxID=1213867 RepID=A0A9N8V914_9GLOM|nr:6968_t:CDS:10 [Diversispora eburnea]